ncbi:metallophosphoesterase 1 isoform X2 [Danaus plexippus]|uniref:metallophosphoesterase 1 isoform X2 n=1 Tax=Danaus plexippus TaxID=13037 RepID=UPI002AB062DC|nr:metallophosphoesterase 1 isoform X2 [Danaus plexippus]
MFPRRSSTLKFFLISPVIVVLYCEWLVYLTQPFLWNELKCNHDNSCTKILFIADPQIQGEQAVPQPLSILFNWDSDRYLKSTFSVVVDHFKPDVLVYLGDLMDEGSMATKLEYHSYVKRLAYIFDLDYPIVQVWLPGDNDIGGENEPIKFDKITEFGKVFKQPSVIMYRNITFYKINSILYKVPQASDEPDMNVRIAVAHYPVLARAFYGRQVENAIHPDIYFCAHEHVSKYTKQNKNVETHFLSSWDSRLDVSLDDGFKYEIYVPTCSYRMGTSKIGYGAAVIVFIFQRTDK